MPSPKRCISPGLLVRNCLAENYEGIYVWCLLSQRKGERKIHDTMPSRDPTSSRSQSLEVWHLKLERAGHYYPGE